MRFTLALVIMLAACGGKSSSGPAWPKSAGRVEVDPEKDGGQSLEPQQGSNVAAIERTEDRTPAIDAEAIVVEDEAPKPEAPKPEAPKPEAPKPDTPKTGDIQIDP